MSTTVRPTEQADVIISDLRGVLPLLGEHIVSIADARKRLLAPGGVLIPQRDKLWVACVEAEELYSRVEKPWSDQAFGIDMSCARKYLANQWFKADIKPEQLLGEPASIGELDYRTVEDPNFSGEATTTFARDGVVHGICVWFDTVLAEGIGYSNAPGRPYTVYGRAFFPWLRPLAVRAGDTATVSIDANLVAGEYVWNWTSRVLAQGDTDQVKAEYRQSSFYGELLLPQSMRKKAAEYVPSLNIDGSIDQMIIAMMKDGVVLGDIATKLTTLFPEQFPLWRDALSRVGDLSSRYCR
jgi:protein arginine N-methyltransferase 1